MSEKKHIILTNMDTKLWNKFKGVCYTNGEAMNRVVSHLITTYIQENKQMRCPVDIEKLYNDYIQAKYKENYEERYKGKEEYYHASSSGFCSRKNLYLIHIYEPTRPERIS